MSSPHSPDDPDAEQPFVSHLIELRDRLLRMLIAVFAGLLLTFPFANPLYTYVAAPLLAQLPEGSTMIATQVASPFLAPFKLALVAAVMLAMPYLLYQLWAFVAPGLYRHEKRFALPLLVSSILLFYVGMLFAYYVVFPLIFAFMSGTTPDGVAMMTDIAAYLDFVLALFLAFGLAFEIPIATILLVMTGLVTPDDLAEKRPYVIVGAFVIGMLLTPPDVFSQTLLAVPMCLLYELGILMSRLMLRQRGGDTRPDPPERSGTPRPPLPPAPAAPPIGHDLDPNSGDPERWRPLTDVEMEAELDRLDLEQAQTRTPDATPPPAINSVADKLHRAHRLRELDNDFAARVLLYEVLEEGDADQRRVARHILRQMDTN